MTNRPRINLGLESSSVVLNRHAASVVGQKLARARAASRLSLGSIADRLLLSRNQVRALEDVDPDVFYNVQFHVAALRKYADLVHVDVDGIGRLLIEPGTGDPPASRLTTSRRQPASLTPTHLVGALAHHKVHAAVGAGTVVAIVVILLLAI